jgi:hypothetical protein
LPGLIGEVTIDGYTYVKLWKSIGATSSGGNQGRVSTVMPGAGVTISFLTIAEGYAPDGSDGVCVGVLDPASTSNLTEEHVRCGEPISTADPGPADEDTELRGCGAVARRTAHSRAQSPWQTLRTSSSG